MTHEIKLISSLLIHDKQNEEHNTTLELITNTDLDPVDIYKCIEYIEKQTEASVESLVIEIHLTKNDILKIYGMYGS